MAPVSAPTAKSLRREPGATGQNSRQPFRVAARIGAGRVARLANSLDIACIERLTITNSGSNAHVFHAVMDSYVFITTQLCLEYQDLFSIFLEWAFSIPVNGKLKLSFRVAIVAPA